MKLPLITRFGIVFYCKNYMDEVKNKSLLLLFAIRHTVYVSRDSVFRFSDIKFPQISRTFLTILAEYKMTLFCNSTTFVSMPITSSLFLNSLGVIPKAPIIIGMTLTCFFQIFLNFLAKSWYFSIFSNSFASTLLSKGIVKSVILHVFFFLSITIMTGLLASIPRIVRTSQFHIMWKLLFSLAQVRTIPL